MAYRDIVPVDDRIPRTAFGESLTATLTPEVALIFPYDTINPGLAITRDFGSGTASSADSMLNLSTGAATSSSSTIFSRNLLKYNPGQGVDVRFTGLFTTGVAGSQQVIGIGDEGEGHFFGYNGADFGVLHRYGGEVTITTLTVSTASSTAEDITITLDGDTATDVSVTNTGDTTLTANEIAAHDYSAVGNGWDAAAVGSTVVFTSWDAAAHGGAFTLSSATSAVGAFVAQVTGVAPTETWVGQDSWNVDGGDGNGALPTMDFTKGNVFRIEYQYLGFGAIKYEIEDPRSGDFRIVHVNQYANTNTRPSLDNPTMPLCAMAKNTTNNTDIVLKSGSMMGAIQGQDFFLGAQHGTDHEAGSIGTSEIPIFTIRNRLYFDGHPNRTKMKIKIVELSNDHSKAIKFRFYRGATLTGASFTDVANSPVTVDTSATAFSGGLDLVNTTAAANSNFSLDFGSDETLGIVQPGASITITAETTSGTGGVAVVSMFWVDLI